MAFFWAIGNNSLVLANKTKVPGGVLAEQARQESEGHLVKNCIRAIFYHEFSEKPHQLFPKQMTHPAGSFAA